MSTIIEQHDVNSGWAHHPIEVCKCSKILFFFRFFLDLGACLPSACGSWRFVSGLPGLGRLKETSDLTGFLIVWNPGFLDWDCWISGSPWRIFWISGCLVENFLDLGLGLAGQRKTFHSETFLCTGSPNEVVGACTKNSPQKIREKNRG